MGKLKGEFLRRSLAGTITHQNIKVFAGQRFDMMTAGPLPSGVSQRKVEGKIKERLVGQLWMSLLSVCS